MAWLRGHSISSELVTVRPQKKLIGVMMTQLYPSGHVTLANDFKKLAYESLTD